MAISRCCEYNHLYVYVLYIGLSAIIQSVYAMAWNTWIMLMYDRPEIFMNQGTLEKIAIDLSDLENKALVYKILSISILANCIWFTSSIFLIVGNSTYSFCSITTWIFLTILITIGDVGTTSYFAVKLWYDFRESHVYVIDVLKDITSLPSTANLVLTLLFSKGIVVLLFNVISAVTVYLRSKEMPSETSMKQTAAVTVASDDDDIPLHQLTSTTNIADDSYTPKLVTSSV